MMRKRNAEIIREHVLYVVAKWLHCGLRFVFIRFSIQVSLTPQRGVTYGIRFSAVVHNPQLGTKIYRREASGR